MTKETDEEVFFIVPASISSVDRDELLKACEIANFSKTTNGLFFWIKGSMVASPTTLFPSAVPRENFYELKKLQIPFNRLYHKISLNTKFIKDCLESARKGDEFCANLLNIVDEREKRNELHKAQFGIFRADYMFEKQENGSADGNMSHQYISRQIEVNTIACSFAGLSEATANLHKNVANFFGETYLDGGNEGFNGIRNSKTIRMPKVNYCLSALSSVFIEAFNFYSNKIFVQQTIHHLMGNEMLLNIKNKSLVLPRLDQEKVEQHSPKIKIILLVLPLLILGGLWMGVRRWRKIQYGQ